MISEIIKVYNQHPFKTKIKDLISIKSIICHSQHSGVRHEDSQEVAQRDQVRRAALLPQESAPPGPHR